MNSRISIANIRKISAIIIGVVVLLLLFPAIQHQKNEQTTEQLVTEEIPEDNIIIEPEEVPQDDNNNGENGQDTPVLVQEEEVKAEFNIKKYEVQPGDTFSQILQDSGINKADTFSIINELKPFYDVRDIRPSQELTIIFKINDDNTEELSSISTMSSYTTEVKISSSGNGVFDVEEIDHPLKTEYKKASTIINSTLFESAQEAGIPNGIMAKLIKLYSYDIDFQRDIRKGNKFTAFYEQSYDEKGNPVQSGEIIFSSLEINDKIFDMYQFTTPDGEVGYYSSDGTSVKKSFLKTPVDGARISSGFGARKHPVLGYTKLHKGIDFAAPTGTPVYAAGNGIIKELGRKGSYGKFIRIDHKSEYSTAYAHLNRFAQGVSKGSKVEQGQVIAYVGTTGRSTGPHLHYEVRVNDVQINPLSIKSVAREKLAGIERGIFMQYKKMVDKAFSE